MSDEIPLYDPLEPEPEPELEPIHEPPSARDGISPLWIVGVLLGLVLLVAGAWWVFLRPPVPTTDSDQAATPEPPPQVTESADPAESDEPSGDEQRPPRPPLPPLDQSDGLVRDEVGGLSGRGEWAAWLTPEDLVRRFVASVANVAEGESPRAHAQHLAPSTQFEVIDGVERLSIDSSSYQRYDVPAAVFASLDIGSAVALYHDLEPLFEEAYAEIGDPRRTFRETLAQAIDRLIAVDVPDGDIEVVRHATHFKFADPELEAQSPAAKHLLRMGPTNANKVQQKLRFLRSALDL
ncbi:MAG: DUF3014 domain-containing protein [Acidobacteriota bacterium]